MNEKHKIGENFDKNQAEDIFEKLKNVEGKIKQKRKGKFDNITNLMDEAKLLENSNKYEEAIKLYNEVIFTLPDSKKAYEAIIKIYQKLDDKNNEKETLKKAINNCNKNEEFKKRLKELS
ncbi:MAG: hypothetical protein E7Z80_05990 [Methanobrevibacter thaueri]|nr:hypothetical protein [Methanobrevibacter thaueri]